MDLIIGAEDGGVVLLALGEGAQGLESGYFEVLKVGIMVVGENDVILVLLADGTLLVLVKAAQFDHATVAERFVVAVADANNVSSRGTEKAVDTIHVFKNNLY